MPVMKITVLKIFLEDKEQRKNFVGSVAPQGTAKHVTELKIFSKCFSKHN
jgi:hypothetical protein